MALSALALVEAGLLVAACGNGDQGGFTDGSDAGVDGTVVVAQDGAVDSYVPPQKVDAAGDDAGGCSPAKGPCNLVAQDCPPAKNGQPQECVAGVDNAGAPITQCQSTQPSQLLQAGRACCPDDNSNPCLPGLTCLGTACADGGPQTGRCSPACCDNSQCGMSFPEGISGTCNVDIVGPNNTVLFSGCTYQETCKPLGVQPCKTPNSACMVQDQFGTSICNVLFGTPIAEHAQCGGVNQGCGDGMDCFGKSLPDGAAYNLPDGAPATECLYFCYTPGTIPPFDAGGMLDAAAGKGGCPATESCKFTLSPTSFPAWLSVCGH
jgi:hypothetical protein